MPLLPTDTLPFAEIARRPLNPQECALVVIDIQEKLLPLIHEKERMLSNSKLLIRMAHVLGLPVILTTQYAKGLGATVPDVVELLPGVTALDKVEFGCFGNGAFCSNVARLSNRNTLLLCGIETHICVLQTALGALAQGRIVHVAADALGSSTQLNWELGIGRMRDAGVVISSTEMMVYELLGRSGTAEFKEMLKYVKEQLANSKEAIGK
jgi:nicotinamidase-related amidase